jgi:hypothetical protein
MAAPKRAWATTQDPPMGCISARKDGFTIGTTIEAMIARASRAYPAPTTAAHKGGKSRGKIAAYRRPKAAEASA